MQTDRVPLNPEPIETETKVDNNAVQESTPFKDDLSYLDSIEYHRTADFFNLSMNDRKDSRMAEQLGFLMDWAKDNTQSEDRIDNLMKIKSLTKGLGLQMIGKDLIKRLYRWVRLDNDRKRIEKQQEVLSVQ